MSRMLEAKAELSMRPSFDMPRNSRDNLRTMGGISEQPSSLANRLMEIFNFETAEDVIEGEKVDTKEYRGEMLTRNRIPLLVTKERPTSGIHVHYYQAHLLLCILA